MFFKEFREKLGISQKEAFEKLEIQQATLAKYESESISPSIEFLKRYCTALNANPNFILFGVEPHLNTTVLTEQLDHATAKIFNEAIEVAKNTNSINKLRMALIDFMEENK